MNTKTNLINAIFNADEMFLTALSNKGIYNRALKEYESSVTNIEIAENGESVKAEFSDGVNISVTGSVQNYKCACPSRTVCKHLIMAVIAAREKLKKDNIQPDSDYAAETTTEPPEKPAERKTPQKNKKQETIKIETETGEYIIPYIKQFIYDIFSIGLARNPDIISQRFLQLATICRSRDLADFERICNRISAQYELFEKKSALFSADYLMDDLCSLILRCEEIEKNGVNENTAGVFRERYNQIPPAEFHGLGAYQWNSSSGYTGVTAIFYSPELSDIAAYASVLPDTVNPDAVKMYNSPAPWGIPTKFSEITDICLLLQNAKIRSDNNISSSNETSAQVMGKTNIFSDKLSKIIYNDFALLTEKLWEKHAADDETSNQSNKSTRQRNLTALVLPKKYGKASFDSITQIYSFTLYDKSNRKINVSVKYEPSTAMLIENLKKLERRDLMYGPVLLRVYVENGRLNAFPVSLYIKDDEEDILSDKMSVINLSLDDLDAMKKDKDRKDSKKGLSKFFDW